MSQIGKNMSEDERAFGALAQLAYEESGLILVPEKFLMVLSRLRPRMKALNMGSLTEYQTYVCAKEGKDELRLMISSLTTNVSHFFREAHHFEILCKSIGRRVKSKNCGRVRVWSAGCSNGQEAISIGISLLEAFPELRNIDFKILATDIDPNVVTFARKGIYPKRMVNGLSEDHLSNYFSKEFEYGEDFFRVKENLRSLISFKELNLLKEWPMKQSFDAIFCRNVVIYFDAETQASLWPRFHNILRNDGVFFLGHSERIAVPESFGYMSVGPTAYVKTQTDSKWDRNMELEAKYGAA